MSQQSSQLVSFPVSKKLKELEADGKQLYKTNRVMKDVGNVMEHPLMREFLHKYFSTWKDAEAMLMLLKTYEHIDQEFAGDLNPYQKLALLHQVLHDSQTRALIRDKMVEFKQQ